MLLDPSCSGSGTTFFSDEAERQATASMAVVREQKLWEAISAHAPTVAGIAIARGDLEGAEALRRALLARPGAC